MLNYNRKIKKILHDYVTSFEPKLLNEDKNYLIKNNILVNKICCNHDEVCQLTLDAYVKTSKAKIVNSFLYGLAYNNPIYTCGLSAYAMMLNFKKHNYQNNNKKDEFVTCYICNAYHEKTEKEYIVAEALRLLGYTERNMFQIYFNLSFMPDDIDDKGILKGENRLLEVIRVIKNLEQNITPNLLIPELKSKLHFTIQVKQLQAIIESLGMCGILQPKEKPSYLNEYFPRIIEEKKSQSSNWSYPVDFWVSQDGINFEAIEYWFQNHEIILNDML